MYIHIYIYIYVYIYIHIYTYVIVDRPRALGRRFCTESGRRAPDLSISLSSLSPDFNNIGCTF